MPATITAATNLYCPVCLKSQPHVDLGRELRCRGCSYRREREPGAAAARAVPAVGRYEFQIAGADAHSFRNLCRRCAATTWRAGEQLAGVVAMAGGTCVQCLAEA